MTNRLLTILIMETLAVAAYGRNSWYDTPIDVYEGVTVIETLSGADPMYGSVQVRAAAPCTETVRWGIMWNYTDTANYMCATLTLPKADRRSSIYGQYASLCVTEVCAGSSREIHSASQLDIIDMEGGQNSLKLIFGDGNTRIVCGASEPAEICTVPSALSSGMVAIRSDADIACQRITTDLRRRPAARESVYGDLEALAGRISQSKDIMEGAWEYLDRDTDPDKAQIGGHYRLLTVSAGDHYDIVYVSGATIDRDLWTPLSLKGRLHKTIFKGNYDLEWYTSDTTLINDDTNAQLSDDAATLTLRFPTIDAEIRLKRITIK